MVTPSNAAGKAAFALRLGAELAVVALGVFLGLAADSWRESRADLGREATYVRALRSDVAAALVALDEASRLDSIYLERSQAALAVLRSDTVPTDDDWSQSLGFQLAPLSLPSGTVDALIQTGDLGLIQSDSLSAAVRELSASLASNLGYLRDVNSRAGLNVAAVGLELETIRIASGGSVTLDGLRRSPVVLSGYSTHGRILLNRLGAIEMIRDAFEAVEDLLGRQRPAD
jgi:hypothetical protein